MMTYSTQTEEPDPTGTCLQTAIHILKSRPDFGEIQYELRELGQPVLHMRRADLYGLQGWPGDPVICVLTPDGVLTHRVIYLPPRVVHVTSDGRTLHLDLFLREMRWLMGLVAFCHGIDKQCLPTSGALRDVQLLDYPEPRIQSVNCTVMLDAPKNRCFHCRRRGGYLKTKGRGVLRASVVAGDRDTLSPFPERPLESPPLAKKLRKTTGGHEASASTNGDAVGCTISRGRGSEHTADAVTAAATEESPEKEANPSPSENPRTASQDKPEAQDLALEPQDLETLPLEMSCDTVPADEAEETEGSWEHQNLSSAQNSVPRLQTSVTCTHSPVSRVQGENSSPPSAFPGVIPIADKQSRFRRLHPDHPDIVSLASNRPGAVCQVGILNFKPPGHKSALYQTRPVPPRTSPARQPRAVFTRKAGKLVIMSTR